MGSKNQKPIQNNRQGEVAAGSAGVAKDRGMSGTRRANVL